MIKPMTERIIDWLRQKLGDDYQPISNPMWIEHGYAFGCTETGFSSAYTIDYQALEQEMDRWISETFGKTEVQAGANTNHESSASRFELFVAELRKLCRHHGVVISASGYEGLEVWNANGKIEHEDPIYCGDIENCISD
jgi:hypothetical protein